MWIKSFFSASFSAPKSSEPQAFPALSTSQITKLARSVRTHIIKMLVEAESGHSAGALGMADVFATLYGSIMQHDPHHPNWQERDRLFLSNGHICPVIYACLAELGYFPKEELYTLRKRGTRLQGHPHFGSLPGIENTSGPLGQGLSQALGTALGLRIQGSKARVYCSLSDAELQEGQNWEAFLYASAKKVDNLTAFIDRNNIQIGGKVDQIVPLEPLMAKLEAFGWHVTEADGHSIGEISSAFQLTHSVHSQPSVIIFRTTPGKGVDFMENKFEWHGKPPNQKEAISAVAQIEDQGSTHEQ